MGLKSGLQKAGSIALRTGAAALTGAALASASPTSAKHPIATSVIGATGAGGMVLGSELTSLYHEHQAGRNASFQQGHNGAKR